MATTRKRQVLFSAMLAWCGLVGNVSAQEAAEHGEAGVAGGLPYNVVEDMGAAQSPINILSDSVVAGSHRVELHYRESGTHIANLGHTVEAIIDAGSQASFDGRDYTLQQIHFHTPSEHQVDGITYPMEMHMVHTLEDDPGRYLVIGVLFREGRASAALEDILAAVPDRSGEVRDVPGTAIDAGELLAFSGHYFHYEGSLTTPPYTEAVTWLVMQDIHQATQEQIQHINVLEGNNARHIQALHARVVDAN